MCEYCEKNKVLKSCNFAGSGEIRIYYKGFEKGIGMLELQGDGMKAKIFKHLYCPRFDILYCPMCRKEARGVNEEIWKDIKNFEGIYQISNLGQVKAINYKKTGKKRILKQADNGYGYKTVHLTNNGKGKMFTVHRLVAETFIPNTSNKPIINHIDGNKSNNKVENLEWCTYKENTIHAWLNGLSDFSEEQKEKLKHSKRYKRPINQYDLNGNFIKRWESIIEVQRKLKISNGCIYRCCKGEKGQTHGYKWQYADNKKIYQYDLNGKLIGRWISATEIERELKINKSLISKCLNKHRKTAKGFIWRYVDER